MNKFIIRNYILKSNKINKEYNILGIADTHFNKYINSKLLNTLKTIVISKQYDFILISGDIMNPNMYLNDKSFNKVKSILDNISVLGKCPIYITLGNHDINTKYLEEVINKFESFKYNSNLLPLNNRTSYFEDISISGITLPIESYDMRNIFYNNGTLLNEILSNIEVNNKYYNISLVHDPLSVYNSFKINNNINKFDLIFSGHLHGGYLSIKNILDKRIDKGYMEYFKDFKLFIKVPFIKGEYLLNNTSLIINEGFRRYNNLLPSFIYTTPFFSDIKLVKKH